VTNTHTAHAVEVVAREAESLGLASLESRSHDFDQKMLAREEEEYVLADALLVPSEFSMQTFLDREIPREKLVLHHYGYDSTRFFEGSKSDGPFTAIFVGRCEPRKGLHYALRAWIDSEASADGRFVICGAFEPKYREVLEPLLAHPSVEIRGFVSDVAALMRDSDVLVLPSVEEGSALVTYEAQACGCVLLVSEPVGAICQHEIDALVHSAGDVKALAEHFTRLYRDRDLLGRLREATLLRAEDLSWSAAGRQLLDIYAAQVGATPAVA
jgi:glycosyltransferase involved in cell wall biosynthesis